MQQCASHNLTVITELAQQCIGPRYALLLCVVRRFGLKSFLIVAIMIVGMLPISAAAEANSTEEAKTSAVGKVQQQGLKGTAGHVTEVGSPSHESQPRSNSNGDTIVVDVWSKVPSEETSKLSTGFAAAGLAAASKMQSTERRIEQSIKRGFPLGEFWIQVDFDQIDDSIRLATLAAGSDSDRQALGQLEGQRNRLRVWTDWLIQQNRQVRLANYYISPEPLDNDERFQSSVTCTNFLLSMLASRNVSDDASCR